MRFYIPSSYIMSIKGLNSKPFVDNANQPPVLLYRDEIKFHPDYTPDTVEILSTDAGEDGSCYEVNVFFGHRANIYLQGLYSKTPTRLRQNMPDGPDIHWVCPPEDEYQKTFLNGTLSYRDYPNHREYVFSIRFGEPPMSLTDILDKLKTIVVKQIFKR